MKNTRIWLWALALGSAWGLLELVGGNALSQLNIPYSSAWLMAGAFFLLGFLRGTAPVIGTASAAGITAALFKLVNAPPFYCHLLAIVCVGFLFDAASAILIRARRPVKIWRGALVGILAAYGGHAAFAVLITYVFRYEFWVAEGLPRVLRYVFLNGSLAAGLSAILVPASFVLSERAEKSGFSRRAWATAGALALLAAAWIAGRLAA
jgi:hypothetical protein